ncbi:uncharacterized protein B0T15DRAFT_563381 [Chaetomium strumarium]|uniref:Uncharacterized protein n=1 Tax=Chaetomium strumarium TaxID=1170767 RepID=A0AAJ0LXX4_9PEZI|nr:hypothetical protein B0T15DRAFT_563381 [Chaetomium strumarium]
MLYPTIIWAFCPIYIYTVVDQTILPLNRDFESPENSMGVLSVLSGHVVIKSRLVPSFRPKTIFPIHHPLQTEDTITSIVLFRQEDPVYPSSSSHIYCLIKRHICTMTNENNTKTPLRWETLPRSPFRWLDESFPKDEVEVAEVETNRRSKSRFSFDESSNESPMNKVKTQEIAHRRKPENQSDGSLYDGHYDDDETADHTNLHKGGEPPSEEPATPPTAFIDQRHQVNTQEEVAALLGEEWYPQTLPPRKRRCHRLGPNEVVDYARLSLKTAEDYEGYHSLPKINFHDTEEDRQAALERDSLLVYLTQAQTGGTQEAEQMGQQSGTQTGTDMGSQTMGAHMGYHRDDEWQPVVEHIEDVAAEGSYEGGAGGTER